MIRGSFASMLPGVAYKIKVSHSEPANQSVSVLDSSECLRLRPFIYQFWIAEPAHGNYLLSARLGPSGCRLRGGTVGAPLSMYGLFGATCIHRQPIYSTPRIQTENCRDPVRVTGPGAKRTP